VVRKKADGPTGTIAYRRPTKGKSKRPPQSGVPGKSVVNRWKDGSGEVRVGKNTVDLMLGVEDVSNWSDEELMWGARRDKQGRRPARMPHVIPLAVYQELVKRMKTKVMHRFAAELTRAVEKHMEVIKAIEPSDGLTPTELKAIEMLYDRVLGKAPEHITIDMGEKWQSLVAGSIVATDDDIVEGEIVEEELLDDVEERSEGNGRRSSVQEVR
jgi:hypothetical protein